MNNITLFYMNGVASGAGLSRSASHLDPCHGISHTQAPWTQAPGSVQSQALLQFGCHPGAGDGAAITRLNATSDRSYLTLW